MSKKNEMACTEAELLAMTRDMDDMHRATFPQMQEMLSDFGSSLRGKASRRSFLAGSGVVLGGVALAACGGSDDADTDTDVGSGSSSASADASADAGGGDAAADRAGLATNASLENLAVFAYDSALKAAPSGKFGPVPPAVAVFAKTAMGQHAEHAKAFNAALVNAGGKEFTEPDPALAGPVTEMFTALKDLPGLAKLALLLEQTATQTYTKQMGEFKSKEALALVATIAPVEHQHAATLLYVIGEYPVPDTFVKTDLARPSSDAGVS
ncbi:MAG TPA: ferritin-like domain-containing protein [Mycobacteriales bacterium]|nr:ferritin-like domain-containing protein [Mycobacteriales bacterium]